MCIPDKPLHYKSAEVVLHMRSTVHISTQTQDPPNVFSAAFQWDQSKFLTANLQNIKELYVQKMVLHIQVEAGFHVLAFQKLFLVFSIFRSYPEEGWDLQLNLFLFTLCCPANLFSSGSHTTRLHSFFQFSTAAQFSNMAKAQTHSGNIQQQPIKYQCFYG